MKTSELIGLRLDYWVAKADPRCEGLTFEDRGDHIVGMGDIDGAKVVCIFIHRGNVLEKMRTRKLYDAECYAPSFDWSQGGPIIEREQLDLFSGVSPPSPFSWAADNGAGVCATGPTPLVAAMRAYVASKFGSEVPDQVA